MVIYKKNIWREHWNYLRPHTRTLTQVKLIKFETKTFFKQKSFTERFCRLIIKFASDDRNIRGEVEKY